MPDHYVHIVDDEVAIRESIGFQLRTLGLKCIEYLDGKDFLERYRRVPTGCVILDIFMPRLTGLEVQKELKLQGAAWPVVFISGRPDRQMVTAAIRDGALDFIAKPFSEDKLLAALHRGFRQLRAPGQ